MCAQISVFAIALQRTRISEELEMNIYFKKEFQLPTGSFKERGARNTLELLAPVRPTPVVYCTYTHTSGVLHILYPHQWCIAHIYMYYGGLCACVFQV